MRDGGGGMQWRRWRARPADVAARFPFGRREQLSRLAGARLNRRRAARR